METPLLVIFCSILLVGAEDCPTEQYTKGGECCRACGAGEGVVQECGMNQTVCEPCLDSVTYSDTTSHTEACKQCTECDGIKRMLAPCVETDDALCACAYGYYKHEDNGECIRCRTCPIGYGMILSCTTSQNTVCEKCPEWTYSNVDNNMDPCLPCTICEDDEVMETECTSISDTVCYDPNPRISSVTPFLLGSDTTIQDSTVTDPELSSTSSGGSEPIQPRGATENLIAVSCSILAAAIAGVVAFIVFKRWNSCKQNKQGGNSHPVNQTPSPEGEKLHSDSGISVNSDSTAEQPAGHMQGKNDHLYNNLSPHKQEEVEKLLSGSLDQTWKCLAGELGYQDELIDSFTQEECPVRALLSDWSSKDSSTTDALYTALRKIQREDIAQSLYSDSTATSPV